MTRTLTPRRSRKRSTRSARRPSSSRAATARRQPASSSTAIDWSRFRASATQTGLHTDRAAHSSALAAGLALGLDPLEAAEHAKLIASEAVRDGLRGVGEGAGPIDAIGLSGQRAGHPSVP